jgi:hypothetical protein
MTKTRIPRRIAALLCLSFALLTPVAATVVANPAQTVSADGTNGVGPCC